MSFDVALQGGECGSPDHSFPIEASETQTHADQCRSGGLCAHGLICIFDGQQSSFNGPPRSRSIAGKGSASVEVSNLRGPGPGLLTAPEGPAVTGSAYEGRANLARTQLQNLVIGKTPRYNPHE
jgi:hypothetical protein